MDTNVQIDSTDLSYDEILGRRLIYLINKQALPGFSVYFSKYGANDWKNELYYRDPKEIAKVYDKARLLRAKFLGALWSWIYVKILTNYVHKIAHIEFKDGVCCVYYKKDGYLFVIQRFIAYVEKELKCKTELIYERYNGPIGMNESYAS